MNFRHLHYFRTIVEEGQINSAAHKLNISQPPLSQRLQELEEELGVCLIFRKNKQWQVTAAGEKLYTHAQNILAHMEAIKEDICNADERIEEIVRIAVCPPAVSMCRELIPDLAKKFPSIHYRLMVWDNDEIDHGLALGNLDLGILILPVHQPDLTMYRLPMRDYVAVYGPGIPQNPQNSPISVQELAQTHLLLARRNGGGGRHEIVMQTFQRNGLTPSIILESPDTRFIMDLVCDGFPAIALIHSMEVVQGKRGVRTFPVDIPGLDFTLAICHNKNAYIGAAVNTVLQEFLQRWGK